MLGNSCFASANLARYDNSLSHSSWETQQEAEKLPKQTFFFLSMGQAAWNVVDVEFCLILKYAFLGFHSYLNLKSNTFQTELFFSLLIEKCFLEQKPNIAIRKIYVRYFK
jgi:hypothetical protein